MVNQRNLLSQLITIFEAGAPPFVFVHEPPTSSVSSAHDTVQAALESVANTGPLDDATLCRRTAFTIIDCAATFTPRLLFDGVLSGLDESLGICVSVKETLLSQKTDSLDSFIHALENTFAEWNEDDESEKVDSLILVFERVERLRYTLPGLVYPLSRLYELVVCNQFHYNLTESNKYLHWVKRSGSITTVFLSEVSWEHITLVSGTFPDPFLITLDPPDKIGTTISII